MSPSFCQGYYGFKVMSNGAYQAGPSSSDLVRRGQISDQELTQLTIPAQAVAATSTQSQCEARIGVPGSSDHVTLVQNTGASFLAYDWEGTLGKVCYQGERTSVLLLQDRLNTLMKKYYPAQFP